MRAASERWTWVGAALLAAWLVGCSPPPRSAPRLSDPDDTPDSEYLLDEHHAAARAAFVRGTFLAQQGDVAGALQEFAAAVRLEPRDPSLRLALATLQFESGRWREARDFLQESMRRYGGTPREHLMVARLQAMAGLAGPALTETDAALRGDSTLAPAWLLRGQLLLEAERFPAALACYQHAAALLPHDPPTLEGLADCYAHLGRVAEAEASYRSALQLDPDLATTRDKLLTLYRDAGRAQDVERVYLEILGKNPGDLAALDGLLEVYLEADDVRRASELLRSYQERRALTPELVILYARMLLQQDRLAAADSVLQPLVGVDDVGGLETLRGDIAVRGERFAEARAHYRRAIAEEPEECEPRVRLALVDIDSLSDARDRVQLDGELGEEVRQSLQAAARNAGADDFHCNLSLGIAYFSLRQFEVAARHLRISHKIDPKDTRGLFALATVEQELGHFETACREGEELVKLDPDNATALNFLGYILAERGQDLDHSEALIRRALTKEPENGYFVDSLGWVLYQRGDYPRAAAELERAAKLTGEREATILEHLGDAYVKIGRPDDAYRVYKLSTQIEPDNAKVVDKLARLEKELGKP